jgi:hypothetical protein
MDERHRPNAPAVQDSQPRPDPRRLISQRFVHPALPAGTQTFSARDPFALTAVSIFRIIGATVTSASFRTRSRWLWRFGSELQTRNPCDLRAPHGFQKSGA